MSIEAIRAIDDETPANTAEHWNAIYAACRLETMGYSLEEFLANPWHVLREAGQEGAVDSIRRGYEPLLPAQARIARELRTKDDA